MEMKNISEHCECCICRGKLPEIPTLVGVPVIITWKFPRWGNFIYGQHDLGVAYICDKCDGKPWINLTNVNYVLEFKENNQVVYHAIAWINETTVTLSKDIPVE